MAPFKFSSKPPPLPPKDAIYQLRTAQHTSSRVDLVPDSPVPSSPSAQYAVRRANSPFAAESMSMTANNSSVSDLLSPQDNRASASKKALGFLKFPKRGPKSPPPPDTPILVIASSEEPDPPPPQEDDGISLPWNFQHNIHVDEGYVGLPPSWSTSLAAAGFTDEEIEAIQNRRATGVRSPADLRYLYNERPQSPAGPAFPQQAQASTSNGTTNANTNGSVPILTHPTPRTSSLPRVIPLASSASSPPSTSASASASVSTTTTNPPPPVFSPPQRAALPSSASTPSLSAAAKTTTPVKRVPPPKRKPPTPYEDLTNTTTTTTASTSTSTSASALGLGHRPNQASSSTIGHSSDSHASSSNYHPHTANTTFTNMSMSAAYAVNPPSPAPAPPPVSYGAAKPQQHPYASPAYVGLSYSNPALNGGGAGDEDGTGTGTASGSGSGSGKTHAVGASMSLAGGTSRFRVVNGDRAGSASAAGCGSGSGSGLGVGSGSGTTTAIATSSTTTSAADEKPAKASIWGTRLAKKDSPAASASGHSDAGHGHAASSSSSHLPLASTSTSTSASTTFTAAAASASSSLAHASSSLADAVRGMGAGLGRMRAGVVGGKKDKDKENSRDRDREGLDVPDEGSGKKGKSKSKERGRGRSKSREREGGKEAKEVDSDEEFVSLPAVSPDAVGAGFGGGGGGGGGGSAAATGGETRTPVWQIYSRPRAGTDASGGAGYGAGGGYGYGVGGGAGGGGRLGANAGAGGSQHSLTSGNVSGNTSGNGSGNVSRRPSVARSLRSAASQGSLRSRLGRFANVGNHSNISNANNSNNAGVLNTLSNRSVGSLHSTRNGSVTSLESIPEGASSSGGGGGGRRVPPPMPEDARDVARSGSVRRGTGHGQSYAWSPPGASASSSAAPSSSASSSSHAHDADVSTGNANASAYAASPASPPPRSTSKRTAALPPRLSLHQSKDSTDLSSWSEALLSGISLSGDGGGLGLSFGLGAEWEKGLGLGGDRDKEQDKQKERNKQREREREAESPTTVTTATAAATARPWERPVHPPPVQQPPAPAPVRKLPTSKPPPSIPIPAIVPQRTRSNSRSGPNLPLPVPPVAAAASTSSTAAASSSSSLPPAPAATTTTAPAPSFVCSPNGLLSPPPSAWAAASMTTTTTTNSNGEPTTVFSPAASSTGPDSAQLWNEIEQMMDPGMMSAIPGLHLSVALPQGAQDVLKTASVAGPTPGLSLNEKEEGVRTVGDVVGRSPVEGVLKEEEEEDGSVYDDDEDDGGQELELGEREDAYEGIDADEAEEELYGGYLEDETPDIQLRLAGANNDNLASTTSNSSRNHTADAGLLDAPPHFHSDRDSNRDSSRSSSSTLTVTALAPATIVRNVSVARRAGAYVVDKSGAALAAERARARHNEGQGRAPVSPLSSHFGGGGGGSEESTGSSSTSTSSSRSRDRSSQELQPTPTTDGGISSPLLYYLEGTQTPSPTPDKVSFALGQHLPPPSSMLKGAAWSRADEDYDDEEAEFAGYPDEETMEAQALAAAAATSVVAPSPGMVPRPTIVISDAPLSSHGTSTSSAPTTSAGITPETATPLSPFQRYRGWLSAVVAPLEEFIDDAVDPREHFLDLREIAEGESGSVYSALLSPANAHKLRLPPLIKAQDADAAARGEPVLVAVKSIAIVPGSANPKLADLQRELALMRGHAHAHVLGMDGVYVDLVEDALWVRMELMERSLADIIALVGDGLQLQERTIARFASDVLSALEFLQSHHIAHRDVRSDNLLLNKNGVLKLADFSNAVQVTPGSSMRTDSAGVVFWQAPEVRRPPYDALKVDVWSLGATVWEMAQQDPPFADTQQLAERWPPLRQPELFSPAFHEFLRRCSEPAGTRPGPGELLKSSFIVHKACGRHVIVLLLSQCMAIEKLIQEENAAAAPS